MQADLLLLRLGEYTLKGRNRGRFERQMLAAIKQATDKYEGIALEHNFGRIYVRLNGQPASSVARELSQIFGISSVSPVIAAAPELEAIRAAALSLMLSIVPEPATFKVSTKRAWKAFPHDSQQMNHLVGAHVLRNMPALKVDVRQPAVELKLDIQQHAVYVYNESIPAVGGFPYGTNGKALLLLSGGIDSPVAGWFAMRKGLALEAVHFHSYPFTSEQAKDKVIALARRLSELSGKQMKVHLVPFTDIQTAFAAMKQDHLIITLMRRAMLRIAEALAEKQGAMAIVTGDSLGQVASQTLGSMNVIGKVATLPLLRPLVMMDKQEIVDRAVAIGTYNTSILPYEDCCTLFVPKSPSTNPNLNVVEKVEQFVEGLEDMIHQAVASTEVVRVTAETMLPEEKVGKDSWF